MTRVVYSTLTCDRCGTSRTYELEDEEGRRMEREEWASLWPQVLTPLGSWPERETAKVVCEHCITREERESLAEQRLRGDIPF